MVRETSEASDKENDLAHCDFPGDVKTSVHVYSWTSITAIIMFFHKDDLIVNVDMLLLYPPPRGWVKSSLRGWILQCIENYSSN